MTFKPLLASPANLEALRYPIIGSFKLDGIRCIIGPQGAVSRRLKFIQNRALREKLNELPVGFDGELICGQPNASDAMQRTSSAVMSHESNETHLVRYHVFDLYAHGPYVDRYNRVSTLCSTCDSDLVQLVQQVELNNIAELTILEKAAVELGYEGIMLRDPNGVYKLGRSTEREGILLKVKRFQDAEAMIIGFEELMHNSNEATINNVGKTQRSSAKSGMVPMDTLGAIHVTSADWSSAFSIGSGWTAETRKKLWEERDTLIGRTITFKYQPAGVKSVPRFPVFKAFRLD